MGREGLIVVVGLVLVVVTGGIVVVGEGVVVGLVVGAFVVCIVGASVVTVCWNEGFNGAYVGCTHGFSVGFSGHGLCVHTPCGFCAHGFIAQGL